MSRTARQPDHRPAFNAAALPWAALSQAARERDAAALEALWRDHKRPEQARAYAVRAVFAGACGRGDTALAGWVQNLYGMHIGAREITAQAGAALAAGRADVWHFLCEKIDALPRANEIYAGLLPAALVNHRPEALEKIRPHLSGPLGGFLHYPVTAGQTASLDWLLRAGLANDTITRSDTSRALVQAATRGQTDMIALLLDAGADPDAFGGAAIRHAGTHAGADGGAGLAHLLRAGANPQTVIAAASGDAALCEKLAALAALVAEEFRTRLQASCGQPAAAGLLRAYHAPLGTTGLHFAAEHRLLSCFSAALLDAGDFAQKNAAGETVIEVLARKGGVDDFFATARWRGQTQKLEDVLALLPAAAMDEETRADLLRRAERETLESAVPAGGFKLSRRPKP